MRANNESMFFKTHQKRLICDSGVFALILILFVSPALGNNLTEAELLQGSSVTYVSAPSNGALTINPVDGSIQ